MTEEEAMVPHIKRISKEKKKIKIPILNLTLILFCTFLLVVSTFIQLKIIHPIIPADVFTNHTLKGKDFLYSYTIIPQIPMVLFVIGLLGKRLSITSILLYILLGLFAFPFFAVGGGPHYIIEPGFGYILAYIPAAIFAGSILDEDYSFKNIFKAGIIGVLTIHLIGIIYMLFVFLLRHEGWEFIKGWIVAQSLVKCLYDYLLTIICLIVAKYGNKFVRYIL